MIIKKRYPLKKITTIGLGGYCKEFICPEDEIELMRIIHKDPLLIGNGSNICFITEFYDRSIVSLKRMKKYIHFDNRHITCSGNVSCTKLAKYLNDNRQPGYEFLYGIPGTIAGAISMNAGAFKKEIMPYVYSIDVIDENGMIHTLKNNEMSYSYRECNIDEKSIIISVKLFKQIINFDENLLNMLNQKRKTSQPINQLSCGCIFKNPSGDHAARLIDSAELKGSRAGGIYISRKHSNYFINDGSGTYTDFLVLLRRVKETIAYKFNIKLDEEVILLK
tara:strand:- start:12140 stop:12973 length:834 start_codon:yes stop_codon:yes gene_type:complete